MLYVVTEFCIQCKCIDCAAVCPMDYFYASPNFLVINPDECIGYLICMSECPVGTIYPAAEVSANQQDLTALNAQLSHRADWSRLTKVQAPLQDHAYWAQMKDKYSALIIAPD